MVLVAFAHPDGFRTRHPGILRHVAGDPHAQLEFAATRVRLRTTRDSIGDSSMRLRTRLVTALALLGALSTALASSARSTQASSAPSTQPDGLRALDGE